MPQLAVVVELQEADADAYGDALLDAGALAVSVEDADAGTAAEQPLFGEPGAAPTGGWTRNVLRALVDADADVAAMLATAAAALGWERVPRHRIEPVPEEDWVRATQAQFDPIRVSDRLWIVPSWHVPPDPAALNIVLDPGLAFGTGSHPTTRLCLRWLEARVRGGESVLDYGCGSGILAIAAARLGAGRVTGIDIDPDAVRAARANAAANNVDARFAGADATLPPPADVVVANILASPLKVLAPLLGAQTRAGGCIVLAGLLDAQAEDVAAAYGPWFDMTTFGCAEGWTALEGLRR
jgi:ribosomal protein L11 methyltransferase